jgi:hypothetical protein
VDTDPPLPEMPEGFGDLKIPMDIESWTYFTMIAGH